MVLYNVWRYSAPSHSGQGPEVGPDVVVGCCVGDGDDVDCGVSGDVLFGSLVVEEVWVDVPSVVWLWVVGLWVVGPSVDGSWVVGPLVP